MKVSEFLGTRVLDKNAIEIGRVSDMYIDPIMGTVNIITISTNEFGIRKKDIEIKPKDIAVLGDYLLLKIEKADINDVD
jgi:sporulation protein YlmC with PRC-barrel domain